ncbi:MAG TPA: hypothetical protein VGQ11_12855, partial [Candidatus Acidoferrales bacterium]|nr:hypothetical protein [Candidatus Acidoferrales bacterium]
MNRPAGVTVSAVFLILGSVLTALMGLLMLLARSIAPPVPSQPPFYDAIMVASSVTFLGFAVWGGLTAAGLFRMRRWARISILVIGALVVIFCSGSLAILLFVSRQMPEFEASGRAGTILGVMIGMYVVPMLLGLWWLIYFNLAAVKATFLQGVAPDESPRRPLSIAVIAWHFVAFGLLTPISLWMHFPAFFLGMVLTGWLAVLVYSIYSVLELSIGVGLLRLRPW